MTDPEGPSRADLEKANRTLERRLQRLETNVTQLEAFQDSNSRLLTQLIRELETERARSRSLLLNVLPERVVRRLEAGETRIADRHDLVSVLFSDFVGFTEISARLPPATLVEELNELFRGFDAICEATGVEKIKTVGDAYLAVGGLSGDAPDGAIAVAEAALGMAELVRAHPHEQAAWQIRIGIHAGPIVAGVVGSSKFAYDVWGDTVNVASRLESTSEPGGIHVSSEVAERLASAFVLEPRGAVDLKGKGAVETFFLRGRRVASA